MSTATPPMNSTDTGSTGLFCCDNCYVLSCPRGPHENAISHFNYYMMRLTSAPSSRAYLPALLSCFLEQSTYVIRFERWVNAEKDETRFFMPNPRVENSFIEVEDSMFAESSKKDKWVQSWRYLKFRCDEHEGSWYTCFLHQRAPRVKTSDERKRKYESYGDDDDGEEEEEDEDGEGRSRHGREKRRKTSASTPARKPKKGVEFNPDDYWKEKEDDVGEVSPAVLADRRLFKRFKRKIRHL